MTNTTMWQFTCTHKLSS